MWYPFMWCKMDSPQFTCTVHFTGIPASVCFVSYAKTHIDWISVPTWAKPKCRQWPFFFSYKQYHSTSPYRCPMDLIFYMRDKHMETCKWMSWIVTSDLGRSYFAHMRWSSHERILISLVYKSLFIFCVFAKAVFWFWLCGGIYKEKGNCWGTKNINSSLHSLLVFSLQFPFPL